MLSSTLPKLRCPVCGDALILRTEEAGATGSKGEVFEVLSGSLDCEGCQIDYPILGGVAVLVEDVLGYVTQHVKGISQIVKDSEIPKALRSDYLEAKAEIQVEHIEEDLEAERVIALYFMNHYLSVGTQGQGEGEGESGAPGWWKPRELPGSPLIDSLVRTHWDQGPLAQIARWLKEDPGAVKNRAVIELGCGVAGLSRMLEGQVGSYLGVDSSFASVALGRHLALAAPYPKPIRIPADLLQGPVSREVHPALPAQRSGSVDLVVGEIEQLPVVREAFDVSIALNAIDMLHEPETLPVLQRELVKPGGSVIQSCPYIWHEGVARELRARLPEGMTDSARAVEWLYEQAGLEIEKRVEHLPWLFFKHLRQLEIYSVHLFQARR